MPDTTGLKPYATQPAFTTETDEHGTTTVRCADCNGLVGVWATPTGNDRDQAAAVASRRTAMDTHTEQYHGVRMDTEADIARLPADDLTIAQTVQRAATVAQMRATAARASSSGRWYVQDTTTYPQRIGDNASAVRIAQCLQGPELRAPTVAPFIAAADPVFFLTQSAAWAAQAADMEAAGAREEERIQASGIRWVVAVGDGTERPDWTAALAAARTYLGQTEWTAVRAATAGLGGVDA
jgi:hypothetical protein